MLIRSILQSIFLLAATQTIAAGHNSMITYQIGDNEYKAFVAEPEGTASTTVYIIHDRNGLNDYEIGRARMLAEQGYRAVALDLFGLGCMNYQKHIFTHTNNYITLNNYNKTIIYCHLYWKSSCRWFDSAPGHHFPANKSKKTQENRGFMLCWDHFRDRFARLKIP